jgi:hypothetical protein
VLHGARLRRLPLGRGMAPARSLVGRGRLWRWSVGGAAGKSEVVVGASVACAGSRSPAVVLVGHGVGRR